MKKKAVLVLALVAVLSIAGASGQGFPVTGTGLFGGGALIARPSQFVESVSRSTPSKVSSPLTTIQLQNALQKQQQVLQLLSNVSKQLSDTALNTIRKIGG